MEPDEIEGLLSPHPQFADAAVDLVGESRAEGRSR
ncbi:hypothetical protein H4W79_003259 [Nocardiopsis terrae]|uniref:Uncharacterized protein n=1 Tax=Nocardiopsis terrae TaxID=372655 RepID=A0ABR9HJK2_9ACTN|nr:hypothetical protein [Nocardiopsis terrae]